MALSKEKKKKIISDYKLSRQDSGSPEVQVAILTNRINELSGHLQNHGKDHHSRFGLIKMVSRRKRLLKYLNDTDPARYQDLITRLNIRK